jgi:hypothetical protein
MTSPQLTRTTSAPDGASTPENWRAARIREWLLLLLRFAVTWDPKDRAAVYAMADEIDSVGLRWRPSAPSFFRRTSHELCDAIVDNDPHRHAVLARHLARIDDPRLQRAFAAAVDLRQPPSTDVKRRGLWAGVR